MATDSTRPYQDGTTPRLSPTLVGTSASLVCALGALAIWTGAQQAARPFFGVLGFRQCEALIQEDRLPHLFAAYGIAGLLAVGGAMLGLLALWRRAGSSRILLLIRLVAALLLVANIVVLLLDARAALDLYGARSLTCRG